MNPKTLMIHYEQESTKQRCSPNTKSINKVCKIIFVIECPLPEKKIRMWPDVPFYGNESMWLILRKTVQQDPN